MNLQQIQAELNAPKNQHNSFGGYNYRSAEGIIAAAKPLLAQAGLTLILTDEVVNIGQSNYVKATATLWLDTPIEILSQAKNGERLSKFKVAEATGWAREAISKKGMDDAQITGSCSSYARKYALNGLFAIDDADQDPDSKDNREHESHAGQVEDKPWLNEISDSLRQWITSAYQNGRSADDIVSNIRKDKKVSKKMENEIRELCE